jgi:hypothetical protein
MPQLAIRGSLGTRILKFTNEGKDGLTVKKLLALFVVAAMVAVFTMGVSGCGKKDTPVVTPAGATSAK